MNDNPNPHRKRRLITMASVGAILVAVAVVGLRHPADAPNQKVDPSYQPPAAAKVAAPVNPGLSSDERRQIRLDYLKQACVSSFINTIGDNEIWGNSTARYGDDLVTVIKSAKDFNTSPNGEEEIRICWTSVTWDSNSGGRGPGRTRLDQFRCFGKRGETLRVEHVPKDEERWSACNATYRP